SVAPKSSPAPSPKGKSSSGEAAKPGGVPGSTSPSRNAPGPSTWAPAGNKKPYAAPGSDLMGDTTRWDLWWRFNSPQVLGLEARSHKASPLDSGSCQWAFEDPRDEEPFEVVRPTPKHTSEFVIPALQTTLANTTDETLIQSCLTSLAKIGEPVPNPNGRSIESTIRPFLKSRSSETFETAVLALGILGRDSSAGILLDLMNDQAVARKFIGQPQVPMGGRVFATYALGLIGQTTSDNDLRRTIAHQLASLLTGPNHSSPDLKLAAMTAFGLTPLDLMAEDQSAQAAGSSTIDLQSRRDQLDFLWEYLDQDNARKHSRTRSPKIRAHAPSAIARLLNRNGLDLEDQRQLWIGRFLETVDGHSKYHRQIQRSSILALGQLIDARGTGNLHRQAHLELQRICKGGEPQARRFAIIALAQIAARPATSDIQNPVGARKGLQEFLVEQLEDSKGAMAPWAALALGIHAQALTRNGQDPIGLKALVALRIAAKKTKSPEHAGAYMLALGLASDVDATDFIVEKMNYFTEDETRGYCAVALGLMNEPSSIESIQDLLQESRYRPGLLHQTATGLAMLGDENTVDFLVTKLSQSKSVVSQTAIASALGSLGDARAIDGLIQMLQNPDLAPISRAGAAMALGMLCDRSPLPWNTKLRQDSNYLTEATTLTSSRGDGVLDRR
ncbi:MAG: hypothetical protein P1V35_08010, partial [Planctomycetota bacterium]|nr:hypothetical protein [Planctomycetota bacterium]